MDEEKGTWRLSRPVEHMAVWSRWRSTSVHVVSV